MIQNPKDNSHQFLRKLECVYNRVYPDVDADMRDMQLKAQFWNGLLPELKEKVEFLSMPATKDEASERAMHIVFTLEDKHKQHQTQCHAAYATDYQSQYSTNYNDLDATNECDDVNALYISGVWRGIPV